jgi:hypothetical protein
MMRREQEMLKTRTSPVQAKKEDVKLPEFLKSQKGSRIYQRKLNKIKPEDNEELLQTLKLQFSDLLTNMYGNYFCQKLYTICNISQRCFILENVKYNNLDQI